MSSVTRYSLPAIQAHALAATAPPPPKDIASTITLTAKEDEVCSLLDKFTKELRTKGEEWAGVECRIAGGWVRDKLLGIPSNDIDITLANIMGVPFAEKLQGYMISRGLMKKPKPGSSSRSGTIATIGKNPEQSKHLETARMKVLGHEVDFVNLRSETYAENSRIPTMEIGTPLEDALRRDITINTLFYNIHTRSVEDFTEKGIEDLRNGVVRTPLAPLETFRDDPLRVLRCVRFSSRFGFKIAKEAANAMQEQSIQDALITKISRERVGEEFTKMLKGTSPLLSISTIDTLGLYTPILGIPPILKRKAIGTPGAESTAIQAASILCDFLAPTPSLLPSPHPLLLEHARERSDARGRLVLAATLTPWKNMKYSEKKKRTFLAEGIIREGLRIGGHFLSAVPNLFQAHELISKPSLGKFEGPSERSSIGLILRDKSVHSPQSGTYWSTSLLFSLVQDLVESIEENSLDAKRAEEIVQMYNSFIDRVVELKLVESIEEQPRLNGKDICALLDIKPGKEIGMYMEQVVRWQLDHPDADLDACKAWLKQAHESGSISIPQMDGGDSEEAEAARRTKRARLPYYHIAMIVLLGLIALPVACVSAKSTSNWLEQGFFFAWGNASLPFPVPTTAQCETIKIQWGRGSATGPDPVAPYTLQILTSNYITPFYIDAGSSLSYDYTVPFAPGTRYQICMYDSKGQTGGCQASYTVIAAPGGTPSCTNVTFPASLEVEASSSTGPLSQYGWPNQCTDISVKPKTGTPPFTFTAAPALHPPVNITSNSMNAINWTIDLSWGSPFFITLADSSGLMWSYGPLHSGGNGPTGCLAGVTSQAVPVGATVGGAVGVFVLGGVAASLVFFWFGRQRRMQRPMLDMRGSSGDLRPTPYIDNLGLRTPYSPLGMHDDTFRSGTSSRPLLRYTSRSSRGIETPGLASTAYPAEPFDPASVSAATSSRRGRESSTGTYAHSSPPVSPHDGPHDGPARSERDTRSQVYVVHHDGGRAPVTIMTSDGAEVVELPPGYGSVPESSRQRAVAESLGRSGKSGR
ncbi:CCA tRNA nucleotidyltransferase, mitochondrial [Ceratobasidium sp. 370]|nr:CCA tRNA nucleotidyltransferase, mitochondrial [Ceratobasidium sp. 370]